MNVTWRYGARHGEPALAADPELPQAARFEAGERPLGEAAAALGLPTGLHDGDLLDVWYLPGRALEIVHRAGGRAPAQAIRVRCVPRSALAAEAERCRRAAPDPGRVAVLESWSAVATLAIDDPLLPGLRTLAGLPDAELVSYLPARRAVVRVPGAGGTRYAKVAALGAADARRAVLDHLWQMPDRAFAMARPLDPDPDVGTQWAEAVEGESLAIRLAESGPESIVVGAVRALAALHAVPPWATLGRSEAADILARLRGKALRRIDVSVPSLAGDAAALAVALGQRLPHLSVGPPVVIHGDFHAANVLMVGDDVALLDLDDVTLGDPEYDLAVFGGRLLLMAMVTGRDIPAVTRAVAALPDAYAAAGGRPIDPSTFAWYLAATLVSRQVKACLRCLPAGAAGLGAALVALALATLHAPDA